MLEWIKTALAWLWERLKGQPKPPQTTVTAERGGVAVGRDVHGNISTGELPPGSPAKPKSTSKSKA